jgi:hypothetical protein
MASRAVFLQTLQSGAVFFNTRDYHPRVTTDRHEDAQSKDAVSSLSSDFCPAYDDASKKQPDQMFSGGLFHAA